jgi:hypothetical protein
MKSIGLAMAGSLVSGMESHGYPPDDSFPAELFLFPEYAIYLMLGVRILLLILGDPRKWRTESPRARSCSWDGWRRVCTEA